MGEQTMGDTVDSRRVTEYNEEPAELEAKLDQLAEMMHSSKNIVFFTGAGVSTSAGIADYRGPTGVWTRQRMKKLSSKVAPNAKEKAELALLRAEAKKKGKPLTKGFGVQSASPTKAHMAMSTLIRRGLARHVVTTNLDGLHHKSGLAHHKQLTCLHGDIYIERCTNPACGHEFQRDYHVRNSVRRKLNVHDHSIGTCSKCGSKPPKSYTGRKGTDGSRAALVCPQDKDVGTKDTHINFGESLDDIDWDEAEQVCSESELCIVMGTSMSLRHVTHMPFMARRTVIVNLQKTPDDAQAHLRIFASADAVMESLMDRLGIAIDLAPTPAPAKLRGGKLPDVRGATPPKPGRRPRSSTGKDTATPAVPASAKSMREHIVAAQKGKPHKTLCTMREVEIEVEAAAVGISVKGREVVKVAKGSQAERLGVKAGWHLTHVGAEEMPTGGQAAADAITKALAEGKRGGRPYSILFSVPMTGMPRPSPPLSAASIYPKGGSGGVGEFRAGKAKTDKKAAFGAFSSGLGGAGMDVAHLVDAHRTMMGMSAAMGSLGTASAC